MALDFKVTAEDAAFMRAMANVEKSGSKAAMAVGGAFDKAGASLAGFATVATGVAALRFSKGITDFAGDIGDAADAVQLTAEAFQGYVGALEVSGVSQEKFEKNFTKFLTTIDDAREGNEKLIGSFEKLGISWDRLSQGTPEELYNDVAKGLKNATNETESFAAATDLFGKGSARMIAALREMGEDLERRTEQVSKLSNAEQRYLDQIGDRWEATARRIKVAIAQAGVSAGGFLGSMLGGGKPVPPGAVTETMHDEKKPLVQPAGPDPRLKKREEENKKLLEESQREYIRLEKEAFEKTSKIDKEWLRMHEKKEEALKRELEFLKDIARAEKERNIETKRGQIEKLEAQRSSAIAQSNAFNMMSTDARRDAFRQQQREERADSRTQRALSAIRDPSRKFRDARSFNRDIGGDLPQVVLAEKTIDRLVTEIGKLIAS